MTGRLSADETNVRRSILENASIGSLEFGLAIHPYGDSFAHRKLDNANEMYSSGLGHYVERVSGREYVPDFIYARPSLYQEYGISLYDIICSKQKKSSAKFTPVLDWASVENVLREVSKEDGDIKQIATIKKIAQRDVCQFMHAYKPEGEKKTNWANFFINHPRVGSHILKSKMLQDSLQFARKWSP